MNQEQQKQIQIRASDVDLKGVYSNVMQVSHSQEEFVLDFFHMPPSSPMGSLAARVVLSPGHLKRMILALQENVKKYEERFSAITPAEAPPEIGFKSE